MRLSVLNRLRRGLTVAVELEPVDGYRRWVSVERPIRDPKHRFYDGDNEDQFAIEITKNPEELDPFSYLECEDYRIIHRETVPNEEALLERLKELVPDTNAFDLPSRVFTPVRGAGEVRDVASEHSASEAMTRAAELRTNGTPLYEAAKALFNQGYLPTYIYHGLIEVYRLPPEESEAIVSSLLGPLAEDWFAELHSNDSTWNR